MARPDLRISLTLTTIATLWWRRQLTVFQVTIEDANVTDARRLAELQTEQNSNTKLEQLAPNLHLTCQELAQKLTKKGKLLIMTIKDGEYSAKELRLTAKLQQGYNNLQQGYNNTITQQYFNRDFLRPTIELGLVEAVIPDNPHHPNQRYRLTEKGRAIYEYLSRTTLQ